ncbi:Ras-related C3 botulinum toxin substrate 3 [Polyrhizophydium stewartii]|uniref:Ras-related C3 botulinum toxin substrate 3 n=1 Tax=Polyrhizophydium stewartii TaxID=2732419 RepID=A0ABR4MWZ3_9FUNG
MERTDLPPPPAPLRVRVTGDSNVGKTCMITRHFTSVFPEEYIPTVWAFDTSVLREASDDRPQIVVDDTAGQDPYDRPLFPRPLPASVVLVCFSVANHGSFESVTWQWVPQMAVECKNAPIILVGTKADLRSDRDTVERLASKKLTPIMFTQGRRLADQIGAVRYVECSALTGHGVSAVFEAAIAALEASGQKSQAGKRAWWPWSK